MANDSPIYTHIIVGAGAAGCILASRLSENKDFRVLLLEAGGSGKFDPTLKVPLMTALLLRGRRRLWNYRTNSEKGLDQRKIDLPRGKVLGGSTSVNGMLYARGLAFDYDLWSQMGMPDWSWKSVQPWFLKSEDYMGADLSDNHALGGELAVSQRAEPVSPLAQVFVEAGLSAGYPKLDDFNSPDPQGFGFYQFNIRNGRRESSYTAFLKSITYRPNLTIKTGLEVSRLILSRGKIDGIEVVGRSKKYVLKAEPEIILSAGAIGSPAILLRSGIGPADELGALEIKPQLDVREVGKNLHDHPLIRVSHKTDYDVSLHRLNRIDIAAFEFMRTLLFGSGPMNTFPLEAGAYICGPGTEVPNIQSAFLPALSTATLRFNPFSKMQNFTPGFMANASVMRPYSRGALHLTGKSFKDPLDININYLTDERDLDTLIDSVEILREVFGQKVFDPYRGDEISPGVKIIGRSGIAKWIRETASTVHHLAGSCRMGADKTSVVDPELRVRGIEGLRVVDASIFPSITSANTAAPTMMVAERAADLISREGQTL